MSDKRIVEKPDPEIMEKLGRRIARLLAGAGLTQEQAAERGGVDLHHGLTARAWDNPTLLTVVRMLRVYGRLGALDDFIPTPEISPMGLIRAARGASRG